MICNKLDSLYCGEFCVKAKCKLYPCSQLVKPTWQRIKDKVTRKGDDE